jgi:hypothetical protein
MGTRPFVQISARRSRIPHSPATRKHDPHYGNFAYAPKTAQWHVGTTLRHRETVPLYLAFRNGTKLRASGSAKTPAVRAVFLRLPRSLFVFAIFSPLDVNTQSLPARLVLHQGSQPRHQCNQVRPVFLAYRSELQPHPPSILGVPHGSIRANLPFRHQKMQVRDHALVLGFRRLDKYPTYAQIMHARNIVAPVAAPKYPDMLRSFNSSAQSSGRRGQVRIVTSQASHPVKTPPVLASLQDHGDCTRENRQKTSAKAFSDCGKRTIGQAASLRQVMDGSIHCLPLLTGLAFTVCQQSPARSRAPGSRSGPSASAAR